MRHSDNPWADDENGDQWKDDNEASAGDEKSALQFPRVWNACELKTASQPRWLAKQRIMRGAVNLLVGDEGIGKSLLWVWIVAAVTTGQAVPVFGIPARDPADVILVITEDPWEETVRPRLEVAGADMARVKVICTDDDGSGSPVFPRDMFLITEIDPAPALVVIDAWLDTVPGSLRVKDPQDARTALHPWREMATETGAAILLLTHTNRVSSANARDKYGITMELRKKARVTLYAQKGDDENEHHLIVGPDKMNTAAPVNASIFGIQSVQFFPSADDDDGTIPKLMHIGQSQQTVQEHIADTYRTEHAQDGKDDCVPWLAAYLAYAPQWSTNVKKAANKEGFSDRKLRSAKKRLNIESVKDSNSAAWFCRLPQHHGRIPEGDPSGEGDHYVSE